MHLRNRTSSIDRSIFKFHFAFVWQIIKVLGHASKPSKSWSRSGHMYTKTGGKPNGQIYATVNIFIEWLVFVQTPSNRHTHTHTHDEVSFWVRLRHIAGIFMISEWELMLRVLQSTTYQKHYTSFSRSQPIHYCMLYFTRSYKPFHGTLHFISTQYHTAQRALSLSLWHAAAQ